MAVFFLLTRPVFVRGGGGRVRGDRVGGVERRPLRRLAVHHALQVRHPRLAPRPRRLFAVRHARLQVPLRLVRLRLRLQSDLPSQRRFRVPPAPNRRRKLPFYTLSVTLFCRRFFTFFLCLFFLSRIDF